MSGIFNPDIFNNSIFNTGGGVVVPPVVDIVVAPAKPGDESKRPVLHTFKPTGLQARRKRVPEGRKDVEERIEQAREVEAEVAGQLAREFVDEAEVQTPVTQMSLRDIEAEIGVLLQKKLKTEDEEMMLLMLMIAAAG